MCVTLSSLYSLLSAFSFQQLISISVTIPSARSAEAQVSEAVTPGLGLRQRNYAGAAASSATTGEHGVPETLVYGANSNAQSVSAQPNPAAVSCHRFVLTISQLYPSFLFTRSNLQVSLKHYHLFFDFFTGRDSLWNVVVRFTSISLSLLSRNFVSLLFSELTCALPCLPCPFSRVPYRAYPAHFHVCLTVLTLPIFTCALPCLPCPFFPQIHRHVFLTVYPVHFFPGWICNSLQWIYLK
jgi:hypothetical protein